MNILNMETKYIDTPEWDKTFALSDKVSHKKVSFTNRYGIRLVGDLYMPKNHAGKQPAIRIEKGEYFTRASLFPLVKYTEMSKSDKVQACYQHTCLLYENGMELTNASLRMRLDMNKNNSAGASRIISDTVEAGLIKLSDKAPESKKYSSYVPYYA